MGLYREYIGILENEMETTISYRVMLGVYWDNGKENESCFIGGIFGSVYQYRRIYYRKQEWPPTESHQALSPKKT